VAALLLEAVPTLTPNSVYSALESTAIDMGSPGFDNDSGFGFIQADLAVASILNICPRRPGFLQHHPAAWPVISLPLGSQTYTKAEFLALFDTLLRGDISVILAHQLIVTKLNIIHGPHPVPISSIITDADRLLSQFPGKLPYNVRTSSAIGKQMVHDASILERYNRGDLTSSCRRRQGRPGPRVSFDPRFLHVP
jgi:hypothetical protein